MRLSIRDAGFDDAALLARWAQAMALETEGKTLDRDTVLLGGRDNFVRLDLQHAGIVGPL